MKILAIDTSCDETAVAVTEGRRVLTNLIYSQVLMHKVWGGVVPSLAKRAHEERLPQLLEKVVAKYKNQIEAVAVTQGPGLAIALEVGIRHAKELSKNLRIPLIAVNHMEGHLYSPFVQNAKGNPIRDFVFPYLGFLVSGNHSEFVVWKDHLEYDVVGATIDDAAGEALDKAARLLFGIGYPGGAVMERMAQEVGNVDEFRFPRPMRKSGDLNMSFSGLKTALLYKTREMNEEEKTQKLKLLASSFQEAVFDTLLFKLEKAIEQTGIPKVVAGGGVIANMYLRLKLRNLVKKHKGEVLFPLFKYLTGDNAAMIGVAASYKIDKKIFVKDFDSLDRKPRMSFTQST